MIKLTDPPSLNAKASQIPVDAFEVSSSRLSRGSEQSYDMFLIALIKLDQTEPFPHPRSGLSAKRQVAVVPHSELTADPLLAFVIRVIELSV